MKRFGTTPHIVVGLDESDHATSVLDWAVAEARRRQWSIRVLVGQTPLYTSGAGMIPVDPAPDGFASQVAQEADQRMETARARLAAAAPDVRVETVTGVGTAASLLVAQSREAELVVVGRRSQGPLREAFVGSTSTQVIAHSSCPVVVVDVDAGPERGGGIVVGVDGSPAAEAALGYAFDAAQLRDVPVIAVHAWWLDAVGSASYVYNEDVLAQQRERATLVLSHALTGWRQKYPDVAVREVLVGDHPVGAITGAALGADLIVVGSRGHGGFAGLLLGSVSQDLLHHSRPAPLVVVHARLGDLPVQHTLARVTHQV